MSDNQLNTWFKKFYSKSIDSFEENAIWEGIESKLDKMEMYQTTAKRRRGLYFLLSLLLLIIPLSAILILNDQDTPLYSERTENTPLQVAENTNQIKNTNTESTIASQSSSKNPVDNAKNFNTNPSNNNQPNQSTKRETQPNTQKNSTHNPNHKPSTNKTFEKLTLKAEDNQAFQNYTYNENYIAPSISGKLIQRSLKYNLAQSTKEVGRLDYYDEQEMNKPIQIGILAGGNANYLLNYDTFEGLRSSSLSSNKSNLGLSAAVFARKEIKNRRYLRVELAYLNRKGQQYNYFRNGKFLEENLNLNYVRSAFLYEIGLNNKIEELKSSKYDLNLLVGAYVGYLSSYINSYDEAFIYTENSFHSLDYGIETGLSASYTLNERIMILGELRVASGLKNIYKGNEYMPGDFNATRNFSTGIRLGFSYALGSRTK